MAKLNAGQFTEKWARRTKGALEDMRNGVNAVTEAPGAKAAAKQQKMLQNVTKSIQDGTWANRVKSVDLQTWKDKMLNKGVNRVSGGVDASVDKVQQFATQLLPHIDSGMSKVKGMSDLTLEDNINRMTTFVRHMSTFKKK